MSAKKSLLLSTLGISAGILVLLGMSKRSPTGSSSGTGTLPPGSRVLLVGDSLAVGLASPLSVLAATNSVPFEAHGVVSTRVDQWANGATVSEPVSAQTIAITGQPPGQKRVELDLDGYLERFRPTHVLISLGTNDAAGAGVSKENVARLIAKVMKAGATPLWIGPPTMPFPGVDAVRGVVKESGVRYFPSEILEVSRAKDRIHPTRVGYASWAYAVWQWLLSGHEYEAT